jgi:hypothetical protein
MPESAGDPVLASQTETEQERRWILLPGPGEDGHVHSGYCVLSGCAR